MSYGGHFFTDVFFSGIFIYLIIWVAHGLLYRWPSTRPRPGAVELLAAYEQLAPEARSSLVSLLRAVTPQASAGKARQIA